MYMYIVYPDMPKLQSNHRLYKSDIQLDIDHSNTLPDYNTHLVQTQDETFVGEATHSSSSFAFLEIYSL